jgi:hypothetical protein
MLALVAGLAGGGPNAGGSLIVHTDDVVPYRCWSWAGCDEYYDDPGTCENANTRVTQGGIGPVFIWFLAAFDETTNPCVTSIDFGLEHTFFDEDFGGHYWYCGPEGTLDDPDLGWPEDVRAGNTIHFGSPVEGNRLFPIYYVCMMGTLGDYIKTAIHPRLGYAAFTDNSDPPVIDGCTRFGQVRWDEAGYNECPAPPEELMACCFDVGNCLFLGEESCLELGGEPQGAGSVCNPNPCPQPPDGACCFVDGACQFVDEYACVHVGGAFQGGDTVCDPNPCPQPPTGACCIADGECVAVDMYECAALDGTYEGDGTTCDPNPCPGLGACCLEDDNCIMAWETTCLTLGGAYLGREVDCDPNPCGTTDVDEQQRIETTWGTIKARYR